MSMRKAINEKCKDCIYDPLTEGTWLKQVELCTVLDCGLYPYRPIPRASKPKRGCSSQAQKDNLAKARAMKAKRDDNV